MDIDALQAKEDDPDEMDEEEEPGDDDEAAPETAKFQCRTVAQPAAVNRLRCMPQQPGIVAVWGENGAVSTLNLSKTITDLSEQQPRGKAKNNKPIQVRNATPSWLGNRVQFLGQTP